MFGINEPMNVEKAVQPQKSGQGRSGRAVCGQPEERRRSVSTTGVKADEHKGLTVTFVHVGALSDPTNAISKEV